MAITRKKQFCWNDVKMTFNDYIKGKSGSFTLTGLTNLTFNRTEETEGVYGIGRHPLCINRGNIAHEGTFTILYTDYLQLIKDIQTGGYNSLKGGTTDASYVLGVEDASDNMFINCLFERTGEKGLDLVSNTLKYCVLASNGVTIAQNDKSNTVEIAVKFLDIETKIS